VTYEEPNREIPIVWDTSGEPSAFDPQDWFRYCETVNNRPAPKLPHLGIQSVIPAHLELAATTYGAQVDNFTLSDHPFATFEYSGCPVALGLSAKGSYAAGGLDEMIAMGVRRVIFLGGAGTLVRELPVDALFVPTSALRDDGVSLHYEPPSRYTFPDPGLVKDLEHAIMTVGLPVFRGPIWATTAHFRQVVPRLRAFRAEGCLAVNNEAAAAFSIGRYRQVDVAALVMIGDSLAADRFQVPSGHPHLYRADDVAPMLEIALRALTGNVQTASLV
jgi:purine-nucleoside phosphorylase